jgi:hypothetical protein
MAENEIRVHVELYDSILTPKKDERIGSVSSNGSADIEDLILVE